MLIDGDNFEVTVSGGARESRTKIIAAVGLAVNSVFANQPNVLHIDDEEDSGKGAQAKKAQPSRKALPSARSRRQ